MFKPGCGSLRGYWSCSMMIVLHTPRRGVWVLCGFLFLVWCRVFRLSSCRVGRLGRGRFYVSFTYPVWGVIERITEPINSDWLRGAGCYLWLPDLVFNERLARRGAGFLSDALGLAFLPRDHMDATVLRILVVVDELDAGHGVINLVWCWRVPKL